MNKHIGSNFDDFLKEEGILDEVNAAALERVRGFVATKSFYLKSDRECLLESVQHWLKFEKFDITKINVIVRNELFFIRSVADSKICSRAQHWTWSLEYGTITQTETGKFETSWQHKESRNDNYQSQQKVFDTLIEAEMFLDQQWASLAATGQLAL